MTSNKTWSDVVKVQTFLCLTAGQCCTMYRRTQFYSWQTLVRKYSWTMCCIWENSANSSQQNSLFSSRLASLWPSALIEQAGWHGRIHRRALIKPQSASDSNGLPLDDPHTSGRRPDSNRLFAAGSIQTDHQVEKVALAAKLLLALLYLYSELLS